MIGFLDRHFLRFAWYKKFQAKFSRLKKSPDLVDKRGIESFEPSSEVMLREEARHRRIKAIREKNDFDRLSYEEELEKIRPIAEEEAKNNTRQTEEIYERINNRIKAGLIHKGYKYSMEDAFYDHVAEIINRIYNERHPQKS